MRENVKIELLPDLQILCLSAAPIHDNIDHSQIRTHTHVPRTRHGYGVEAAQASLHSMHAPVPYFPFHPLTNTTHIQTLRCPQYIWDKKCRNMNQHTLPQPFPSPRPPSVPDALFPSCRGSAACDWPERIWQPGRRNALTVVLQACDLLRQARRQAC